MRTKDVAPSNLAKYQTDVHQYSLKINISTTSSLKRVMGLSVVLVSRSTGQQILGMEYLGPNSFLSYNFINKIVINMNVN